MRFEQLRELAARYTLEWRRAHLSGFLSLLSIGGLVLAVALLLLVLSVMNGFDREMRENILSLVPQLTIKAWRAGGIDRGIEADLRAHPEVLAVAPYLELQGMMIHGADVETALFFGISPGAEEEAGVLPRALSEPEWRRFSADESGVLLGAALAKRLDLDRGDRVTLIVPALRDGARAARFEHLSVSGLLETGTELDESTAFVRLDAAARLAARPGRIDGYRLQLRDLFAAPRIGWELVDALPSGYYARDWTQTHGNLYEAIRMSRDLVVLLLLSVIAIAAFNVVSSLVLVVMDKRSDIAILRVMGAAPGDITGIFLLQGLLIALIGAGLGSLLGIGLSLWVTEIVAGIESLFGIRFLNTDVYPIGYLPADLRARDVILIDLAALLLCFLAALYPARRAALLPPVEALRHE